MKECEELRERSAERKKRVSIEQLTRQGGYDTLPYHSIRICNDLKSMLLL